MLNRTLQVKMVKNDKEELTSPIRTENTFEDKASIIGYHFERTAVKIGFGIIIYVFADTLRQVLVALATRK